MATSPQGAAVWREGELVVVRRGGTFPPVCVLSGRPATRRVKCYFHWQERPAHGGPLGLVRHDVQDVWKVTLDLPLADDLMRRRRLGWALFALTAVLAQATAAGLVLGQGYIAGLPAGVAKRWWDEVDVPLIALGGFLLAGLTALGSYLAGGSGPRLPGPTTAARRSLVGGLPRQKG